MTAKKIAAGTVILLVLASAIAQNNGPVYFRYTVDVKAPKYDAFGANTSTIKEINESIKFYANWSDFSLDYWIFEWDITGVAENVTQEDFSTSWSNLTLKINDSSWEGMIVDYKFYARDDYKNWNVTEAGQFTVVTKLPVPEIYEQDSAAPENGTPVKLITYWSDNFEVDHVYLQTNETGDWVNNGSPVSINDVIGWANFTYDTTGHLGGRWWRTQGFDAANTPNSNTSPVIMFTIT
jgi:hypothetical protein